MDDDVNSNKLYLPGSGPHCCMLAVPLNCGFVCVISQWNLKV